MRCGYKLKLPDRHLYHFYEISRLKNYEEIRHGRQLREMVNKNWLFVVIWRKKENSKNFIFSSLLFPNWFSFCDADVLVSIQELKFKFSTDTVCRFHRHLDYILQHTTAIGKLSRSVFNFVRGYLMFKFHLFTFAWEREEKIQKNKE